MNMYLFYLTKAGEVNRSDIWGTCFGFQSDLRQLSLFDKDVDKLRALDSTVDKIREKYGMRAIIRGSF